MYGTKIAQREEIKPNFGCCAERPENPTSGPQTPISTVQNVGLYVAKLLTKNHDDPTVQSPGNEGFLHKGFGIRK
jgi:hypothetical protein